MSSRRRGSTTSAPIGSSERQFHERRLPMKQPIRILGICLLMLAANLEAQAQGPHSPPLVVHFSGTDTFSFFNDCTGETVAAEIAFAGVITQTITMPGGAPAPQLNHFDGHFTVVGTATGQISGTQYLTQETFHNSEAGRMVFPFIQTITHNFRIVSKGGSSNLAFSETYHLTILETGETAVMFDNVRTYCQ